MSDFSGEERRKENRRQANRQGKYDRRRNRCHSCQHFVPGTPEGFCAAHKLPMSPNAFACPIFLPLAQNESE